MKYWSNVQKGNNEIHAFPFPILFKNPYFVIINKPAGLPVHSGRQNKESVETFFPYLSRRKDGPWLAHRLDQDTAGCLVIALRKQALIQAQECFAQKKAIKIYWAIVSGCPSQPKGIIQLPLIKRNYPTHWCVEGDKKNGQKAVTNWRVLGKNGKISCLELQLLTGRTHQARIHCKTLGHPIIGDSIYGNQQDDRSLHLFSRYIALPLNPFISATAPPPPHMTELLEYCAINSAFF